MTQYNAVNVKLSNPQLNQWKSGIKHCTWIKLNFNQMWFAILMIRLILHIRLY